jgi:putative transposase
VGGSWRMN